MIESKGFLFASRLFLLVLLLIAAAPLLAQSPEHTEKDDPAAKARWFLRGRTIPGQSAATLRLRAYRQKTVLRAARAAARKNAAPGTATAAIPAVNPTIGLNWAALGPAPLISDPSGFQDYGLVSGRSTRVLVDQSVTTGNTVYVGGAFGGLWKSTNAANPNAANVMWTPLLDAQPTLAVGAIALKPDNTNVVLVGTGETNNSADSYYGVGMLRSNDGGSTWTLITSADAGAHPFRGLGFSRIVFNSDNPLLAVAATNASTNGTDLGAMPAGSVRGLYYSLDAGVTWQLATVLDGGTPISPGSVTSVVYNSVVHQFFAVVRFHGVYSSADGTTWNRLASQPGGSNLSLSACPTTSTSPSNCPLYRGELALRPGANEMYIWYVNASSTPQNQGIFQTLDGGSTWTAISVTGINNCGDNGGGCGTDQGDYNLTLAAVPNGSNTDLYAGAINIFKCSVSGSNPTCGSAGSWLNLTHVYGCNPNSVNAHVHPDQHDIDFSYANPGVIYFANDGGIYRTLNGPGLNNGSCMGARNPFDSLNGNLGSMTEFVYFSQSPNDIDTFLGGSQDVGSPAFSPANPLTTGTTWTSVTLGDGGFNAINPLNSNEWFAAATDVSIMRCTAGPGCTDPSFATKVSNSTVGGDHGDFYTPWTLDTAATTASNSVLIVGTCRVWRGSGTNPGTTWIALSRSLSAGSVPCSSSDHNLVSALAAGGPATANGFQVIYAGTFGGNLWVTTNAGSATASTPAAWTSTVLPGSNGFPISSITIDRSDFSGQTAYAAVMGFGVPHIYKTVNAGALWTNVSADLPDAPADSILVDPSNPSFLYVGTDLGVFVSNDGGTSWSEYGNLLPAVPVTSMHAFVDFAAGSTATTATTFPAGGSVSFNIDLSNGVRKLRVSTYGRGVWQVDLPASTTVALAVTNLPNLSSFQFAGFATNQPGTINLGAAPATIDLTIKTTAPAAGWLLLPQQRNRLPLYAFFVGVPAVVLLGAGTVRRPRKRWLLWLFVLGLMSLAGLANAGCGGGGGAVAPPTVRTGTPPGTYTVTVTTTANTGSVPRTHTAALNFTVQ